MPRIPEVVHVNSFLLTTNVVVGLMPTKVKRKEIRPSRRPTTKISWFSPVGNLLLRSNVLITRLVPPPITKDKIFESTAVQKRMTINAMTAEKVIVIV